MHFANIVKSRMDLACGVYVMLTRRCPLSCAHCCTQSTPTSEEMSGDIYRRFVNSFTADNHPSWMMITGGEALMRPKLVGDISLTANSVGTNVCLSTGLFFARNGEIPPTIWRALKHVDHVAASLDVYHEEKVARHDAYQVFEKLLEAGKGCSFHLVGLGIDDPYLQEVIPEIRSYFRDRVPIIVSQLKPTGFAASWLKPEVDLAKNSDSLLKPCSIISWPVVGFNGTVNACCNQSVIDGPQPEHLKIGDIDIDSWTTIQQRYRNSIILRAIRAFGPEYIASQLGVPELCQAGYCGACKQLSNEPAIAGQIESWMNEPHNSVRAVLYDNLVKQSQLVTMPGMEELVFIGASTKELADLPFKKDCILA